MSDLIKIDSHWRGNPKKHVRHLATIINGVAHTKCNRLIRSYWEAERTSYFYAYGERYAMPCTKCLPEEYAHAMNGEKK